VSERAEAESRQVLRAFLLAIHSLPPTVSTVQLLYTVKDEGGKLGRKSHPLPYGLRKPYRNLKSENSQDYAKNPKEIVFS
jgi:hypothetical protein